MLRSFSVSLLAGSLALAACSTTRTPRYFPVPAEAENPIPLHFSGATAHDVVPIIAQICSDAAVPTQQIDRRRGYVETRWVDIAQYRAERVTDLPLEERQLMFSFQVDERDPAAQVVRIAAYYQPLRPPGTSPWRDSRYDRLVPTQHAGYQLALELEFRLRRAMSEAGISLVRAPDRRESGGGGS